MNILKKVILVALISWMQLTLTQATTLDSLSQAFSKLPFFRDHVDHDKSGFDYLNISKSQQIGAIKAVVDSWMQSRSTNLQHDAMWASSNEGVSLPDASFFNTQQKLVRFEPFVQKIEARKGEKFILRGDLHGDIHSLMAQLRSMKKDGFIDDNLRLAPGLHMVFLGDYVDKGKYGMEVLYTLACLGVANPDQVHCVRGNHEDINISAASGFKEELIKKFGISSGQELHSWLGRMYDYMPAAIYLGNKNKDFVQLCHGGLEQGYDPKKLLESDQNYQLIGLLHRKKSMQNILDNDSVSMNVKKAMCSMASRFEDNMRLLTPSFGHHDSLGFMWNDFDPTGTGPAVRSKSGRIIEYGQEGVNAVLDEQAGKTVKILGVIRAHQHPPQKQSSMIQNLIKGNGIWNMRGHEHNEEMGSDACGIQRDVITMNLSPDNQYGDYHGFEYDTGIEIEPPLSGTWEIKRKHYYPFETRVAASSNVATNSNDQSAISANTNINLLIGLIVTIAVSAAVYYACKKYKRYILKKHT